MNTQPKAGMLGVEFRVRKVVFSPEKCIPDVSDGLQPSHERRTLLALSHAAHKLHSNAAEKTETVRKLGIESRGKGRETLPLVVSRSGVSKGEREIEIPLPFRRASTGIHSIRVLSRQGFLPGSCFIQPFHLALWLSGSQYPCSRSQWSAICCISAAFRESQFSQ